MGKQEKGKKINILMAGTKSGYRLERNSKKKKNPDILKRREVNVFKCRYSTEKKNRKRQKTVNEKENVDNGNRLQTTPICRQNEVSEVEK